MPEMMQGTISPHGSNKVSVSAHGQSKDFSEEGSIVKAGAFDREPYMDTPLYVPDTVDNLRACLNCRLLQTQAVFFKEGCPNCKDSLRMQEEEGRVAACTTAVYQGVFANVRPGTFVSRLNGLDKVLPGLYAITVTGEIPAEIMHETDDDFLDDEEEALDREAGEEDQAVPARRESLDILDELDAEIEAELAGADDEDRAQLQRELFGSDDDESEDEPQSKRPRTEAPAPGTAGLISDAESGTPAGVTTDGESMPPSRSPAGLVSPAGAIGETETQSLPPAALPFAETDSLAMGGSGTQD